MKSIVLNILTVIGLGIVALSILFAFRGTAVYLQDPESRWSHPPIDDLMILAFFLSFIFGFIGDILAIVTGVIARPRFLWIVFITVGLLSCLSMSGMFYENYKTNQYPLTNQFAGHALQGYIFDSVFLLPGLVLLVAGLLIRKSKKQKAA